MNGEGFAYFRWTQLQKSKYIVIECQEQMKPRQWPIISEWRKLQNRIVLPLPSNYGKSATIY